MGKKTIIGFVVAVFLAGGVSGFFLGVGVQKKKASSREAETLQIEDHESAKAPKSREEYILDWMTGFLEISPAQKNEIRPLLRLALREFDQLEVEHESRVDAFIENSDLRIAEFLTEAQAQKLFAHNRARRARHDERRARAEAERLEEAIQCH